MLIRSKYLKKMQQGGVPSVFAPNPQPYRAPLQGLNPNVFQYDVRTQPLDTSNLIQVMQTKDAMDIKREQAAMERQKIALNKEIKEQELEYKKADMMLDFYAKMLKTTGMAPGADGNLTIDDITTSPRNKKNQAILAEIDLVDKQMQDLSVNLFDKQTPQKMIQLQMRRASLQKGITSTTEEQAERLSMSNLNDIIAGNQKGKVINPYIFDRIITDRRDFLAGKDNGYKFGVTLNQAAASGLVVDEIATKKQFDQLMLDANKAVTVDKPEFVKSGRSNLQRTTTENVFTDSETAAGNIADVVLSTPNLRSYFSMKNGINLYDPTKTDAEYRGIIKAKVKPIIALDDEVIGAYKKVTTQSLASDPEGPRKVIYERIGGYDNTSTNLSEYITTRSETRDTQVSGGVNNIIDIVRTTKSPETKEALDEFTRRLVDKGHDLNSPEVSKVTADFLRNPDNKKAIMKDIDGQILKLEVKLKEAKDKAARQKGDTILGINRSTADMFKDSAAPAVKPSTTPTKRKWKLN